MTWDIFCTVIDNYGDIGVSWRLARQLKVEHGVSVRLWVDDLRAFQHLRPEIDPSLPIQHLTGVEVRHWVSPLPEVTPGEVVIEVLACHLPETFLARMVCRQPVPVWLNLEYLSAEDWVTGIHALPSPHPRLPLTQYFFMPGFSANTGGLTRENNLTTERDAFQNNAKARIAFWAALNLPPQPDNEMRISLFCYENRALPSLLDAWAKNMQPVCVLAPLGKALPEIAAWFGMASYSAGDIWRRGRLTLCVLPMLDQETYDRLLWACDFNFVRGEDSFLRAQFAARPLTWQAYVQEDAAHLAKMDAFLDLYCADLADDLAQQTRMFWSAWNQECDLSAQWPALLSALPALTTHARAWDTQIAQQPDLATNLLTFCRKWLK
jgi:uncharacterized repeat protein (TIGR03837 family)